MQNYALATVALLMASGGVLVYSWSPTTLGAPRTAILTNAKPVEVAADTPATLAQTSSAAPLPAAARTLPQALPTLPDEFNSLAPLANVGEDTAIDQLTFATAVSEDLRPLGRYTVFEEGFYTLYATFSYENMVEGTTWSWVWRHNGQVVGGGEQRWAYGNEGPGYVYFEPEDGFKEGTYALELWLNGELFRRAEVEVSSNIANQ